MLRQGHDKDPRVNSPHPDHVNGSPSEGVATQVFYLLSWCAGLLLGAGEDARPMLDLVRDLHHPGLDAKAIAQCIFESAALPQCQSPAEWEQSAHKLMPDIEAYLDALEQQSQAPDLARKSSSALKKAILANSPLWHPVIEEYEAASEAIRTELQKQETLISELQASNHLLLQRTSDLEKQMAEQQALISELQVTKGLLEKSLAKSELRSEERRQAIKGLRKTLWGRVGARLGLLKFPDTKRQV